MKQALIAAFVVCAVTATAPPTRAQQAPPPPAPTPTPANRAMAYYLVQNGRIISTPFSNDSACHKALVELQRGLRPGTETVFCAHRRP
ncbi:MAG: hypothetical protein WCE44_13580 [Candidatus Velthaea sp.]|jgi:hypothetical protein